MATSRWDTSYEWKAVTCLASALAWLIGFCTLGNIALITGPISTESAPPGLMSSAIGMVVGAGEIFGGGVAPIIAGAVAQNYGIQNILWVAISGVALGVVVSLFLRETAPRKIGAAAAPAVGTRRNGVMG